MYRRWLLLIATIGAMLLAPLAMPSACMDHPSASMAAGHYPYNSPSDDHRAPAKQVQCPGNCAAIEIDSSLLAPRLALGRAVTPVRMASSLAGILLDRDTPPPRLS